MNQVIRLALCGSLCAFLMILPSTLFAGTWTQNSRMDEGRVLMQAASVGTDIYIAGGSSVTEPKASFDLFDTVSNMWRPLPPMPAARERFGMAAFSGRIYVSGGRAREMDDDATTASAALWVFDTTSSDWVKKADMPTERVDHVMVNIGDKLYVLGGTGSHASEIYVYDIVEDKWVIAEARMKLQRKSFGVAVDDQHLHVIGGVTPDGVLLADVAILDTGSQTWTSGTALPAARAGLAAAMTGGRLHVAGGSIPVPAQIFNSHYSLGSGEETWRREPDLPTARHSMANAVVDGKWYLIGGGAAAGFYTLFSAADAVESYSEDQAAY